MAKPNLKRIFATWHRRIGMVSAIFVILLSITGFLLNHSDSFGFTSRTVTSPAILSAYGITPPTITSVALANTWASQVDHTIFIDDFSFGKCDGKLIGAVSLTAYNLIACEQELLVLTQNLELIERISRNQGLPENISAIGVCQINPCIKSEKNIYSVDVDALRWEPVAIDNTQHIQWSHISVPPEDHTAKLLRLFHGSKITWERLIQDIHAGRFLGSFGPLFMDIVAILFLLLAISGIFLWYRSNKKITTIIPKEILRF